MAGIQGAQKPHHQMDSLDRNPECPEEIPLLRTESFREREKFIVAFQASSFSSSWSSTSVQLPHEIFTTGHSSSIVYGFSLSSGTQLPDTGETLSDGGSINFYTELW